MHEEQLAAVVAKFAGDLPREIGKQLEGVDIIVCKTPQLATEELNELMDTEDGEPIDPVAADCKGAFIGDPLEREDDDQEGEYETISLPDGVIVLVSDNVKDIDEAVLVLLHEIGHALGMDEEEVKALGLGVSPTKGEGTHGDEQTSGPPTHSDEVR